MAIITISRELAALGDETARELSNQFGYRFVDKSVIEDKIKAGGIPVDRFRKYDEKKPSFWASMSPDRDAYLHYLRGAVLSEASNGNTVFIGRGAGIILKNVPGVFTVFLDAPLEIRVERVKSYFHCDEKRAHQIVEQSDSDRKGFHRYFFDIKWKDPGNYHLALNTGHFHPEVCAETVKFLCDKVITEDIERLCAKRISELGLAQKIRQCILYEKEVSIHFLDVVVSGGAVVLYGVANSSALIEAAVSYAKELAQGGTVQSEIKVVQEYSVMP